MIKKILIYNWIQFDNRWGIGGGVTVYCKNLIEAIIRFYDDVEVYFISSGWAYDCSTIDCYLEETQNIFGDKCKTYEIINSPVPASQRLLLKNPKVAINSPKVREVFWGFLKDKGPFDVVHFNNIEGLSIDCLDINSLNTSTKVVYSMHNYIPVCVTGFYYMRHISKNCKKIYDCNDCEKCIETRVPKSVYGDIVSNQRQRNVFGKYVSNQEKIKWWNDSGLYCLDEYSEKKYLVEYCDLLKKKINNMDAILAVSQRVRDIAVEKGINSKKCKVSYIGTKVSEKQMRHSNTKVNDKLRIVYLGSSVNSQEKGYPFLLDALASLGNEYKERLQVRLTTTDGEDSRIRNQLGDFSDIEIIHGYTHEELPDILNDCHLGVVPVMWEDNLPQIAIEMIAYGVPVLSSSYGGASELCSDSRFVFAGGDIADFKNKLINIIENKNCLDEYWMLSKELMTMQKHIASLKEVYGI